MGKKSRRPRMEARLGERLDVSPDGRALLLVKDGVGASAKSGSAEFQTCAHDARRIFRTERLLPEVQAAYIVVYPIYRGRCRDIMNSLAFAQGDIGPIAAEIPSEDGIIPLAVSFRHKGGKGETAGEVAARYARYKWVQRVDVCVEPPKPTGTVSHEKMAHPCPEEKRARVRRMTERARAAGAQFLVCGKAQSLVKRVERSEERRIAFPRSSARYFNGLNCAKD